MTSYVESAAKPRDLQRDLAMAAQQNLTKRKSIADHMQVSCACHGRASILMLQSAEHMLPQHADGNTRC